jgi:hypothetical protein
VASVDTDQTTATAAAAAIAARIKRLRICHLLVRMNCAVALPY